MRKNAFLNLFLIVLSVHVFAADGVTQTIDGICRFTFPHAARVSESVGVKSYMYSSDSGIYLVQVKPLIQKDVVKDSTTLRAFYKGIAKGILRGFHAAVTGSKPFVAAGTHGEEIEYVKSNENRQPISVSSRMLLLGDYLIIYTFSAPYNIYPTQVAARDSFFSSFAEGSGGSAASDHASMTYQSNIASHDSSQLVYGDSTPTPMFDSVLRAHKSETSGKLMKSNTLYFIFSFATSILFLAGILYILIRWKKKNTNSTKS
jgi:hypothetical protein